MTRTQGPVDPFKDAALSVWVADQLTDEYAHVTGFGWMKRVGHVWEPEAHIFTMIQDQLVIRGRQLAAMMSGNPKDYGQLETTHVAIAVEKVLQGRLPADLSEFDADPYALNCPNGVVDLCTGKIRDHEPTDRFLRSTAVPYLPGHISEYWTAALEALDSETRDWLQLQFGHAATAHPPLDDWLLLLYGPGRTPRPHSWMAWSPLSEAMRLRSVTRC